MKNKTTLQLLNGIINGVAILCTKTETPMDESETKKNHANNSRIQSGDYKENGGKI